jgi:hypothetical protein
VVVLRANDIRSKFEPAYWGYGERTPGETFSAAKSFACIVSGAEPSGRGTLVSMASPCLAAGTGDLSVADVDDDGQWLVITSGRTDEGFTVYRRVFGGGV